MKSYILALALLTTTGVQASDFDMISRTVCDNNIQLRAETARLKSSLESMRSDNNLPDPEVEFEHLWGQHSIGNKWNLSVSQSFDWPGVYRARNRAARNESNALEYLLRANRNERMLEIRQALADYIYAHQTLALQQRLYGIIDSMYTQALKAQQGGEISILEVNKLRIERLNFTRTLNAAQLSLDAATQAVADLNGGAEPSALRELTDYPIDLQSLHTIDEYLASYREGNPTYDYNRLHAESLRQSAAASRLGYYPGFSVGLVHEWEMHDKFNGFSLGVTLPFFSNRHKRRATLLEAEAANLEAETLPVMIEARVRSDYRQALTLQAEAREYAEIFNSDREISLLRKAYDGGQITLNDYLSDLTYFTQARQAWIDVRYGFMQLSLRLSRYMSGK